MPKAEKSKLDITDMALIGGGIALAGVGVWMMLKKVKEEAPPEEVPEGDWGEAHTTLASKEVKITVSKLAPTPPTGVMSGTITSATYANNKVTVSYQAQNPGAYYWATLATVTIGGGTLYNKTRETMASAGHTMDFDVGSQTGAITVKLYGHQDAGADVTGTGWVLLDTKIIQAGAPPTEPPPTAPVTMTGKITDFEAPLSLAAGKDVRIKFKVTGNYVTKWWSCKVEVQADGVSGVLDTWTPGTWGSALTEQTFDEVIMTMPGKSISGRVSFYGHDQSFQKPTASGWQLLDSKAFQVSLAATAYPQPTLICPYCGKSFSDVYALHRHLEMTFGDSVHGYQTLSTTAPTQSDLWATITGTFSEIWNRIKGWLGVDPYDVIKEPVMTKQDMINRLQYDIGIHQQWLALPESKTTGSHEWHRSWITFYQQIVDYLRAT